IFACWLALMLGILFEMELGNVGTILLFIILIATAMLTGNKLQIDYRNVIALSNRLMADDQLKDEFLARASHELRTPLHVIPNSTETKIGVKKGSINNKQITPMIMPV